MCSQGCNTIMSLSLELAKPFLGQEVDLVIDRPLGSKHPSYGFEYLLNYGFVPNTKAPDGDELDAYFLGSSIPLEGAQGLCIAIIHRLDDDDDKLIVVPKGLSFSDDEIEAATKFQEGFFRSLIIKP